MGLIGIIGAMDEEVTLLKEQMEIEECRKIIGLDFYKGKLHNTDIVVVKCGIGKVNAAVCTQALICNFDIEKIINTGVAGAVFGELKIGDIVISSDAVEHDMDTTAFGDAPGVIPRMDESFFKADEKLIEIAKQAEKQLNKNNNVYVGRVVSGDQFVSSAEKKKWLWDTFNGYCTEMEGAAIAHTCYLNKIPFVIIRSISDSADGSADMDFSEFTKLAAKNSCDFVEKIIDLI